MYFNRFYLYWYEGDVINGGKQTSHTYHSLLNEPNMTYYRALAYSDECVWNVLVGNNDSVYISKMHVVIPKDILMYHLLTS